MLFLNTVFLWSQLLRWHQPTGALLLFFPCLWGSIWVYHGQIPVFDLCLLGLGAVWARSLGCLYNDLVDRDFDVFVSRTKNRPLASGALSVAAAHNGIIGMIVIGAFFLPFLSWKSLGVGVVAFFLAGIYPWMKRFLNIPQLFLGLAFNMGIGMAWSLCANKTPLPWSGICLYLLGVLWTLEYDTIYAYQDAAEDAQLGLKSLAVWLGEKGKIFLCICLGLRLLLGTVFFYVENLKSSTYILYFLFSVLYFYFYKAIFLNQKENCFLAFHATVLWMGIFSMILFWGYAI